MAHEQILIYSKEFLEKKDLETLHILLKRLKAFEIEECVQNGFMELYKHWIKITRYDLSTTNFIFIAAACLTILESIHIDNPLRFDHYFYLCFSDKDKQGNLYAQEKIKQFKKIVSNIQICMLKELKFKLNFLFYV